MDMIVDSRYEVLERIGSGGMGEVWRARDTVLEREVAIKVLPKALNHEPKRLRRFEREARAVAGLTHPNIVAVFDFDFGSHESTSFLVMELLLGRDLSQRLDGGRLHWNEATDIALDIMRGLRAAHSGGIIHRDLKPANVFLCDDSAVKILDFGLARLRGQVSDESVAETADPTLTEHGTVVGTVGYMAPEQVRGLPADVRSDIFSFGCVLYEMLSGRRPFGRGSSADVMAAILRDEPEILDAEVPQALAAVVRRCLCKEPDKRFGSAGEVMAALEAIRASGDLAPGRVPSGVRKWRMPARLFGLRPFVWVAALGLLGLVLGYVLVGWRPRPALPPDLPDLANNRIAVVPFENRSGDPSLDDLGRRATDRIIREFAGVDEIQVAPISVVAGIAERHAPLGAVARSLVHEVATSTSSGQVLVGLIYNSGNEIEIQATLENAASGRTIRSFDTLRCPREEVDTSIDTLAGWVFITAMEELHPSLRFGAGDHIPDPTAFREFLTGLPIAGIDSAAWDHYWKALELDPEFDRIRLYATIALWSQGNWQFADQVLRPLEVSRSRLTPSQQHLVDAARWALDGRWGGSLGILQEYSADNPDDCMARAAVIKGAMATNQPQLALDEFAHYRWDPVQPSNQMKVIFFRAAEAFHQLGQHEQELAVLHTLWEEQQRFFGTGWFRETEARALVGLGRINECRQVIAKALTEPVYRQSRHGEMMVSIAEELHAHGYQEESQVMAQRALDWFEHTELSPDSERQVQGSSITALALLDQNEQAYQLATLRLADQSDCWAFQAEVGVAAARIGNRAVAEEMSRKLSAVDEPFTMGQPSYHRATIAAQLGQSKEAIRLLQQAISLGFHNFGSLHVDLNLDSLRDDPEFREILLPKG